MDGFTSMVAPVMMTTLYQGEKDERKKVDAKTKAKKLKKEETFEEQFGAVYVHEGASQPITYAPPKKKTFIY
jgi:hypothetical protein